RPVRRVPARQHHPLHPVSGDRLEEGHGPDARLFADLDHALEHAEDAILASAAREAALDAAAAVPPPAIGEVIARYGTRVSWRAGEYAMREGEVSEEMYFVESGRLTALLELADGSQVRQIGRAHV